MSRPSTAFPSHATDSTDGRGRWLGTVIVSLGVSLIVIDATIINVLLPGIVAELRLDTTDAEWITSVYSLTFAALLIPFGRAGDLFGRRRMFVVGTAVFVRWCSSLSAEPPSVLNSMLWTSKGGSGGLIGGAPFQLITSSLRSAQM